MDEDDSPIAIKGYFRWHNLPAMLFEENGEEKAEAYRPPEGYFVIPVADLDDAQEIDRFSFERMIDADQAIYDADMLEAKTDGTEQA